MDDHTAMRRRLSAILAADIAGYSRLMGHDEAATVRDLKAHQAVILPLVGRHGGRIIDTAGDGILAEFPSVIGATACAVDNPATPFHTSWRPHPMAWLARSTGRQA
jgi:class 3 adenylate cyclase